ncbi:hypothetical protein BKA61DRAFT_99997 [Leptodontidium sp. MPI-SDFR-AT-0119]|nr:hypothetical protein BKA61DRAFT_99997 [Leptodontidium sp. MPI-SDFR-AT-0119]
MEGSQQLSYRGLISDQSPLGRCMRGVSLRGMGGSGIEDGGPNNEARSPEVFHQFPVLPETRPWCRQRVAIRSPLVVHKTPESGIVYAARWIESSTECLRDSSHAARDWFLVIMAWSRIGGPLSKAYSVEMKKREARDSSECDDGIEATGLDNCISRGGGGVAKNSGLPMSDQQGATGFSSHQASVAVITKKDKLYSQYQIHQIHVDEFRGRV